MSEGKECYRLGYGPHVYNYLYHSFLFPSIYLVLPHNVLNFCTITNYVQLNHVPGCIDTADYNPQHVCVSVCVCVRLFVCLCFFLSVCLSIVDYSYSQ